MKSRSLCDRAVFSRADLVVSCDFEKGILKALNTLECSVKCCLFHMNQAILRFVQKKGMAKRYITDSKFRSSVRSLMVLPLFPGDKIACVFERMNMLFPSTDVDLARVYCYFSDVWIRAIPIPCWCQYDTNFRTNNFAESFHESFSRTGLQQHQEFNAFLHTVCSLIKEGEIRLQSQRLNPKSNICRVMRVRSTLKALVDNYFQGPPLALPLEQLLSVLFDRLHEKTASDEIFDSPAESDGDSSDVAMDIEEDSSSSIEDV